MTPTELELSKSSVNCLPRGVPAIWLQNPYTTMMVHKPGLLVQLYEVLNNWRVLHLDGRPIPKFPEPFFHGNSTARWEGDTLVVESIGRSTTEPTSCRMGGFTAMNCESPSAIPPVDELPHRRDHRRRSEGAGKAVEVRPRRWTLGDGELYEFYCTNNKELEELQKLRELELQQKK